MNQYVFILNDKGERITSLCDNTLSRDDIMAQAEHDYPNAQYVYSADGDSMLDEFMSGKLYVNGKFIEPDPYNMPKYIGDSKVPVMEFCEYCWEVLNDDGTCPTEGCVHNDLMALDEES